MHDICDLFQAPSLVNCVSKAFYDTKSSTIALDTKSLMPNSYKIASIGRKEAVWHGKTKMGYIDTQNLCKDREFAIWRIADKKVNPHGGGDSHNISGRSTTWATYDFVAQRINIKGTRTRAVKCYPFPPVEYLRLKTVNVSGFLSNVCDIIE